MIHLFLYIYYQILFVNFLSEHCIYFMIVSFNSWCDVCNRFYQLNKCRCRCIQLQMNQKERVISEFEMDFKKSRLSSSLNSTYTRSENGRGFKRLV